MGRPRKVLEEIPDESDPPKKIRGSHAVITVTIETAESTITRTYRVPGFLGNTLGWQRSEKGLDDILIPSLRAAFGGLVE